MTEQDLEMIISGDHTPRLKKRLDFNALSDEEDEEVFSLELGDGNLFSPAHTRSGRVYTQSGRLVTKSRSRTGRGTRKEGAKKALHEDTGELADSEEIDELDEQKEFPLFSTTWEVRYPHGIPSSPVLNHSTHQVPHSTPPACSPDHTSLVPCSSPPASNLDKLYLVESPNTACALRLPTQAFSIPRSRSRLFSCDVNNSLPLNIASHDQPEANVNPFTPSAMLEARKRNWDSRFTVSSQSADSYEDSTADESDHSAVKLPANKRIRVSDVNNVNRYNEEFLELAELASGQFGVVKKARHRLDGIVYAIKISKKKLRPNSRDERLGMNEIFAHAAMMKHKHVVRYFNSWVEGRQLFIQNEFCEGGSLEAKISECRTMLAKFSEAEVRKLLLQVGRGLQYIHSKHLVHLDVKPANILIAFNSEESSSHVFSHSPDSGAMSGDTWWGGMVENIVGPTSDAVQYKIGDFGHVVSVQGVETGHSNPEEGDCRYMAPEFLLMGQQTGARLPKADIFSTGMTVFEVASMMHLPRNSSDSQDYEKMKRGQLPFLPRYTADLNTVMRSLVHPDPSQRPTATRLLFDPLLNPLAAKSKMQLKAELQQTREKMLALEQRVDQCSNLQVLGSSGSSRLVGVGMRRSHSSNI